MANESNISSAGLEEAIARLSNLSNLPKAISPILGTEAQSLITYSRANIRNSVDPQGVRYKPLADATIDARERAGQRPPYTPLVRTGNMIRQMFARKSGVGLEFGSSKGYLVFHQQGSEDNKRPPRRAVFPITKDMRLETSGTGGAHWDAFKAKLLALL